MENTTGNNFSGLNNTVLFSSSSAVATPSFGPTSFPSLPTGVAGEFSGLTVEFATFYSADNHTDVTPGNLEILNGTVAGEGPGLSLGAGQIAIAVVGGLSSIVTLVGNILVLYAFCTESRLRTYTNYYIVGLSLADLVAGVFTMPLYSVYWVLGRWPFSATLCDIYLYLNHVFIHVSMLGILVLAVDRYQAVYHPLRHLRKRTLRHAIFMISISYIIPFLLWMPYTILWPYIVGVRRIGHELCYPQYVVDSFFFSFMAPFLFFWIPVPIITVLYWRIYVVIQKTSIKRRGTVMMQELDSASVNSNRSKEDGEAAGRPPLNLPRNSETETRAILGPNADASPFKISLDNPAFGSDENDHPSLHDHNRDQGGHGTNTQDPSASVIQQNQQPILNLNENNLTPIAETAKGGRGKRPGRATPKNSKRADGESRRESHRATRTLTLIFIVLIISTLPWSVLVMIYCLCQSCIPLALYQASVYAAHMNSTVNPFCYAVANPLYIRACTKLCRRKKRKENQSVKTTTTLHSIPESQL